MFISCYQRVHKFLHKKAIVIDQSGTITTEAEYQKRTVKVAALLLLAAVGFVIQRYKYCHVTVLGSTVYSRLIAATLSKFKVSHKRCKGNNRISYYETTDGSEIPFEGPSANFFSEELDNVISFIPCSNIQLSHIAAHTRLSTAKLSSIQDNIVRKFQNGVTMKELLYYDNEMYDPILKIIPFFGKLYFVITPSGCWITNKIISDIVLPLQRDDQISGLYPDPKQDIPVKRLIGYSVQPDLQVKSLLKDEDKSCILYSLTKPRPFVRNNIYSIHPFHLPETWDPFLTIMITTLAVI
jgi:hypothetical protein